jgi:hypothetical protein
MEPERYFLLCKFDVVLSRVLFLSTVKKILRAKDRLWNGSVSGSQSINLKAKNVVCVS